MTGEKISIIIPCYDASATLAETIESVLSQSFKRKEIIVVDDGSTDHSAEIIRSFGAAVVAEFGPNRGVSAARNHGLSKAKGAWIVFLDADDVLLPGTLQTRMDVASSAPCDVVVCDWQDSDETTDGTQVASGRLVNFAELSRNPEIACATCFWAPGAALMYRRDLVAKIGGFRADLLIIQDARFLFDAAYHGARFLHAPHIGARYRVRPDSLSRHDPGKFWGDVLLNGEQIEQLWRSRGPLSQDEKLALAQVYNGAAQGLFRAEEPLFWSALKSLRRAALRIDERTRIMEMASKFLGQRAAALFIRRCAPLRLSRVMDSASAAYRAAKT